jgi:hypothetical protein
MSDPQVNLERLLVTTRTAIVAAACWCAGCSAAC